MYKGKSQSMQRGAALSDRDFVSAQELYENGKIALTRAEKRHFEFGAVTVAALFARTVPRIMHYNANGFKKPGDIAKLLNEEDVRTACGERWTRRLVWFLLSFVYGSQPEAGEEIIAQRPKGKLGKAVNAVRAPGSPAWDVTSANARNIPLTGAELARRRAALSMSRGEQTPPSKKS